MGQAEGGGGELLSCVHIDWILSSAVREMKPPPPDSETREKGRGIPYYDGYNCPEGKENEMEDIGISIAKRKPLFLKGAFFATCFLDLKCQNRSGCKASSLYREYCASIKLTETNLLHSNQLVLMLSWCEIE